MPEERYHGVVSELPSSVQIPWDKVKSVLHPGAHVAMMVAGPNPSQVSVALRRAGFEFRDTLMVYSGEPSLSWKPCFIFRKPAEASTISKQVLQTGTGAINIDGCRVKHASKEDFEAHKAMVDAVKAKGGIRGDSWKNSSDLSGANDVSTAGRWPANVVLVHASGCKLVGETKVDAPVINRFTDGAKPFGNGAGHPYESIQMGDENGQEAVGVYECTVDCPAQALNVESGIRPSTLAGRADPATTHANASSQDDANGLFWGNGGGQVYADSGGASRFFSQFECVKSCPVSSLDNQSGECRSAGNYPTTYSHGGGYTRGDLGHECQGPLYADSGGASRFFSQFEASPDLKNWLLRLVLPAGGRLLELYQVSELGEASEPETAV